MTVNLYKINTENIRVDKTAYLGTATSYTADYGFEGNQNVETPSIIISSTAQPGFNYCYIDSFSRYYYIIAKTWVSDSLWRLSLLVDPLMSFKTDIGNQAGICTYSGKGSTDKYDPRIVYNTAPAVTAYPAAAGFTATGGDPWIVLSCRYADPGTGAFRCSNQMTYLCFSANAYSSFMHSYLALPDERRVAIGKTICSATVVYWLNFANNHKDFITGAEISSESYQTYAYFSAPELWDGGQTYFGVAVGSSPQRDPFYQLSAEEYTGRTYLGFGDSAAGYHVRKAQRLLDIPYIGQLSVDLDNIGVPLGTAEYYLAVEISYDFGGNEYVVTPGYSPRGQLSNMVKCYDSLRTFSNTYAAQWILDASYQGENENRSAQIITLIGTLLAGIISAVATEGATVPMTIASLGVGIANMNLSEQRQNYQQGASLGLSGSSNGGSYHNALITAGTPPTKKSASLYKRMLTPTTNVSSFQGRFGKPDGEYRTLSTLSGTGFAQLGTVILTGFTGATNNEKNMIREALLTGVIL